MTTKLLLGAIGLGLLLAAPTPARAIDLNPLSAIKGAVEAAVEDRKAEDIKKDTEIKARIIADVVDQMGSEVISINVDVYEQDVMLTGVVETVAVKDKAGRLTRQVEGVGRLYNEILVIADIDREKGAVENFVDDSVIEGKINAYLLDAKGVNVTNFRWRSVDGHVFLFGRALSGQERDKATALVREIANVRSVRTLTKVKPKVD